MQTSVHALTASAFFTLGMGASAHCALMCGALHLHQNAGRVWLKSLGRVFGYGLLGAVAGGAGGVLLQVSAEAAWASGLRLLALPSLIAIAVFSTAGRGRHRTCGVRKAKWKRSFLAGLGMGLLPCPLLYATAFYAVLTGSALSGLVLLMAFGLGTIPAVQLSAWSWARLAGSSVVHLRFAALGLSGAVFLVVSMRQFGGLDEILCLN